MSPKIEELLECIADLEETNATLRKQLGDVARGLGPGDPGSKLIASLLAETLAPENDVELTEAGQQVNNIVYRVCRPGVSPVGIRSQAYFL